MASLEFESERIAFKEYYAAHAMVFHDAATSLRTLISLLLADNDSFGTPQVVSRVKERDECVAKFARKYQTALEDAKTPYEIKDYITDLIGVRVVGLYEDDVQLIRDVIAANFEVVSETDKTSALESQEGVFGYKGLHLDVRLLPNRRDLPEYRRFRDLKFEVQVRTIVQDAWSVLDHKIKYKKSIPHPLKRRINRLAALFELADQEFVHIRDETRELEQKAKAEATPMVAAVATVSASPIDAFSFLELVQRRFPHYPFQGHKIDGFVSELLEVDPAIAASTVEAALTGAEEALTHYKKHQHDSYRNKLNPYTEIRHALYLSDRAKFATLLFDLQRKTFDSWLETNATAG